MSLENASSPVPNGYNFIFAVRWMQRYFHDCHIIHGLRYVVFRRNRLEFLRRSNAITRQLHPVHGIKSGVAAEEGVFDG
jgi:hypothetical protein